MTEYKRDYKRGATPRYKKTNRISLRIPSDIYDSLSKQSKTEERSLTNVIVRSLRKAVDLYDK